MWYHFKETNLDMLSGSWFAMCRLSCESWSAAPITTHCSDYLRKCYLHFWMLNWPNVGQLCFSSPPPPQKRCGKLLNAQLKLLHWNKCEMELACSRKKRQRCSSPTPTQYQIFMQAIVHVTASTLQLVSCHLKSNLGLLQVTTVSQEHKTYCMVTLVSCNSYVIS